MSSCTCSVLPQSGFTRLIITGRIDSMSAPELQQQFEELILGGSRLMVADLQQVNFISSAGLRVFLIAQKELTRVGGEIILFQPADSVMRVFTMSGFQLLLKVVSSEEELAVACAGAADSVEVMTASFGGGSFKYRELAGAAAGNIRVIGEPGKLLRAEYTLADVVTIPQSEVPFGAGLAAVGDTAAEFSHLFGESLTINHHIYYYPAVKRPAADYMFYSGEGGGTDCRYLHGFGFSGAWRYLAAFGTAEEYITLEQIGAWLRSLPVAEPLFGVVLLAESKGILGMNLKKIPMRENQPQDGADILDAAHAAAWMNFPVEPDCHNQIIAGVGLVCRDRQGCSPAVQRLFSSQAEVHIHAGVFAKGPVSKNIDSFSAELERILTRLEITRVQHLLGESRFGNGLLGVVALKG